MADKIQDPYPSETYLETESQLASSSSGETLLPPITLASKALLGGRNKGKLLFYNYLRF